jgi:hypothetical protein
LLDIDLRDARCRQVCDDAPPDATHLRIAQCWWCSSHATLFADIDWQGSSAWSATNEAMPRMLEQVGLGDGEEPADTGDMRLALGAARRTPFEALGRFILDETGISQLGGHPEWEQNVTYPRCPSCHQRMECVCQVSYDDFIEHAEGITYAFACLPCGKATTVYQQT